MSYNKNAAVWGSKHQQQGAGQPLTGMANLNHAGMVPFQQQSQVFQNMGLSQQNLGLGLQQMAANQLSLAASNPIFQQQLSSVAYPSARGLNPNAFQNSSGQGNPAAMKQKVFTGTVTQIHENFGFIDDEVFFPRNVCIKGSNPMVGDRVLVEANFNPSMPFKWNATRVQVMQSSNSSRENHHQQQQQQQMQQRHQMDSTNNGFTNSNNRRNEMGNNSRDFGAGRDNRANNNNKAMVGERRHRSRDDRDDEEIERKRRRDEKMKEREREEKDRKLSPIRRRSRSPKARRRTRIIPRYMVQIPKINLSLPEADLLEVKKRYPNLYIPSDFFNTSIRWVDTFPPNKPYALNRPCSFHIMYKELDPVSENDAILEPADADYKFSAKVMLMNVPIIDEIYQKCCALTTDDKDVKDNRDSEDRDHVHPTRLINFLVGLRGKNETMAIGGPWSPSLDGENPESDPSVLIKTAIRTCKALTGIDLSNCTQWYRFVELYYRRGETSHKGKAVPARVETVVIFLPDVWSCLPTRVEWEEVQQNYRKHLDKILKAETVVVAAAAAAATSAAAAVVVEAEAEEVVDEIITNGNDEKDVVEADEEVDDENFSAEPTLHTELNPRVMTVLELKSELKARKLDSKGLKAQLMAKLTKALKSEAAEAENNSSKTKDDSENEEGEAVTETEEEADVKEVVKIIKDKKLDEFQKRRLEKQYTLPDQPHLIVHPSKIAKSGKFDCTTMSLSLLLDYRPEDSKEHSFEVSLFAELFNEMLIRDFGFNIFKALYVLPEKPKEDDKKKKDINKKLKEKDDEPTIIISKDVESGETKKEDEVVVDKKKDKHEDKKSIVESSEEDDDDGRRSTTNNSNNNKDRKKRDRVKLVTKEKHLLLSFIYFDQNHCGFLIDKDLEELFYILGLNFSRSQVKKFVNKAVTRDSLHYRKLTDKPKDEVVKPVMMDSKEEKESEKIDWYEVAQGNRKLLPVFKAEAGTVVEETNPILNDSLVVYQGAVIDVAKLLAQLNRSEKSRIEAEQYLLDLKSDNTKLTDKYAKSSSNIKHLNSEIKDYKEKLRNAEDALGRSNAHAKLFQTTLMDIRDKVEPVLKSASSHRDDKNKDDNNKKDRGDRDNDKKKDRDDGKSRWEKEKDKETPNSRRDDKKSETKKEHEYRKEQKDVVKVEIKKELEISAPMVQTVVKEESKDEIVPSVISS